LAQARVSINRATREELERLPGIGRALAARIVEHRERHGLFRRPEHLIIVRGFGERRFRELRGLITTD
jgi:competence protein ComEA